MERLDQLSAAAGRFARPRPAGFAAVLAVLVVCAAFLPRALADHIDGIHFFRIGTASTAGTYFPVGGMIASAISNPPGSRPCKDGGSCGVPGLIAVATATHGSVANVEALEAGRIDSAFSQSDVAYWAYSGQGIFRDNEPLTKLRAIANLYPETVHLVVRRGSGIARPADLEGKRVSLDVEGSGTRVDALLVLKAFGLAPRDLKAVDMPAGDAADALREDELDAFFLVAGAPVAAVTDLAADGLVDLLPIDGKVAAQLRADYPFFGSDMIAPGTYRSIGATPTLSVGAQWLTSSEQSEQLIYEITKALWNDSSRILLDSGHEKGRRIRLETALEGIGIPLHPGAERYYRETGLLP